jgi:hypothetical protein
MVCPNCSGDYIDGVKVCVACHVLLVEDSSREPVNGNGRLVHFITYFSRHEAAAGKNLLECFDVDAIVSMDEIRGVRLWVHKEDAHKAVKIFQENTLAKKKERRHNNFK